MEEDGDKTKDLLERLKALEVSAGTSCSSPHRGTLAISPQRVLSELQQQEAHLILS